MDERLLQEARIYAANHGTTLNQLVRDLIAKAVSTKKDEGIESLLQRAEKENWGSDGRGWTREELYDL